MSLPAIYRQGGGHVEAPPDWLVALAETELADQRANSSLRYIRIETPPDQLRVDPSDPERAVRIFFMFNPDYVPPEPEAA